MNGNFLIVSAAYLLGAGPSESDAPSDTCSRYARAYRGMVSHEIAVLVTDELKKRVIEPPLPLVDRAGAEPSRSVQAG